MGNERQIRQTNAITRKDIIINHGFHHDIQTLRRQQKQEG